MVPRDVGSSARPVAGNPGGCPRAAPRGASAAERPACPGWRGKAAPSFMWAAACPPGPPRGAARHFCIPARLSLRPWRAAKPGRAGAGLLHPGRASSQVPPGARACAEGERPLEGPARFLLAAGGGKSAGCWLPLQTGRRLAASAGEVGAGGRQTKPRRAAPGAKPCPARPGPGWAAEGEAGGAPRRAPSSGCCCKPGLAPAQQAQVGATRASEPCAELSKHRTVFRGQGRAQAQGRLLIPP